MKFDDLINTIDMLDDEQIDSVVDWQLRQSPAAKAEGRSFAAIPRRQSPRRTMLEPGREYIIPLLRFPYDDVVATLGTPIQYVSLLISALHRDPVYDDLHIEISWRRSDDNVSGHGFRFGLIEHGEIYHREDIAEGMAIVVEARRGDVKFYLERET